ncbi:MAG: DUF3467 domain-containing protein [Planctomycetota bacterium]
MSEDQESAATTDAPAKNPSPSSPEAATNGQRMQVGLRVDESGLKTAYANAFRAHHTAEEVVFDLGMNVTTPRPTPPPAHDPASDEPRRLADVTFHANQRVVMSYYTAKRFAIALAEAVRRHEQAFGDIELDVNKRRTSGETAS